MAEQRLNVCVNLCGIFKERDVILTFPMYCSEFIIEPVILGGNTCVYGLKD